MKLSLKSKTQKTLNWMERHPVTTVGLSAVVMAGAIVLRVYSQIELEKAIREMSE